MMEVVINFLTKKITDYLKKKQKFISFLPEHSPHLSQEVKAKKKKINNNAVILSHEFVRLMFDTV